MNKRAAAETSKIVSRSSPPIQKRRGEAQDVCVADRDNRSDIRFGYVPDHVLCPDDLRA